VVRDRETAVWLLIHSAWDHDAVQAVIQVFVVEYLRDQSAVMAVLEQK
jgi:hypothetical protein